MTGSDLLLNRSALTSGRNPQSGLQNLDGGQVLLISSLQVEETWASEPQHDDEATSKHGDPSPVVRVKTRLF